MEKLEFIVCHNDMSMGQFRENFERAAAEARIDDYNLKLRGERALENPDLFPEQAVVYVHGNACRKNHNVGLARELGKKRHDLKFIFYIDGDNFTADNFIDDDYQFVKEVLDDQFSPWNRFVVSLDHPTFFSRGEGLDGEPIENSLSKYLGCLNVIRCMHPIRKLKGPHVFVCSDVSGINGQGYLDGLFATLIKEVDMDYGFAIIAEQALQEPIRFPEGSVLYVHTRLNTGYVNIGYARELAELRPDLRFIFQIDSNFRKDQFERREFRLNSIDQDYKLAKHAVGNDEDPSFMFVTTSYEPCQFFDSNYRPEYGLLGYMKQLKQLEGKNATR